LIAQPDKNDAFSKPLFKFLFRSKRKKRTISGENWEMQWKSVLNIFCYKTLSVWYFLNSGKSLVGEILQKYLNRLREQRWLNELADFNWSSDWKVAHLLRKVEDEEGTLWTIKMACHLHDVSVEHLQMQRRWTVDRLLALIAIDLNWYCDDWSCHRFWIDLSRCATDEIVVISSLEFWLLQFFKICDYYSTVMMLNSTHCSNICRWVLPMNMIFALMTWSVLCWLYCRHGTSNLRWKIMNKRDASEVWEDCFRKQKKKAERFLCVFFLSKSASMDNLEGFLGKPLILQYLNSWESCSSMSENVFWRFCSWGHCFRIFEVNITLLWRKPLISVSLIFFPE